MTLIIAKVRGEHLILQVYVVLDPPHEVLQCFADAQFIIALDGLGEKRESLTPSGVLVFMPLESELPGFRRSHTTLPIGMTVLFNGDQIRVSQGKIVVGPEPVEMARI